MPLFLVRDRSALFVHVPKTGGVSIEKAISAFGAVEFHSSYKPDGFFCTPQHLHYAPLSKIFEFSNFVFIFAVVRNPIDRFRSAYAMQARMARNANREPEPLSIWAQKALRKRRRNQFHVDNHLRPQVDFIGPGVEVFRYEDGLEPVYSTLCEKLGVDPNASPLGHHNVNTQPLEPIAPHIYDAVCDLYAEDFKAFGYEMPVPRPSRRTVTKHRVLGTMREFSWRFLNVH